MKQSFIFYKILFLILILFHCSLAQNPTQTIRGKVIDKATREGVFDALLSLPGAEPYAEVYSDSSGYFIFDNISPGTYAMKVIHVNFHEQWIHDLQLNTGKELVLEIGLTEGQTSLKEVVVVAEGKTSEDPFDINYLSSRSLTVEASQRYAATFYDPSRLAATGPGVLVTNDEANNLVVRGNGPNGILWKIEGVDVVNPNHLTNAGTLSDKPTLTGGGVSIISTQLMTDSRFLTGAFPAGFGNSLAGVFDMRLRKGNNNTHEFTAQASLTGIDFAAEGPFSKKYKGSYLINYRYSTLGLFSMIGLPLSDENINFQDLSFNIFLPAGKGGDFTLWGLGGKSINQFKGLRDSTLWVKQKDRTDVNYYSEMGAIGITHKISAGRNSGIHSSLAYSGINTGREGSILSDEYKVTTESADKLLQGKLSFSSYYFFRSGPRLLIKAGALINRENMQIDIKQFNRKTSGIEILHNGSAAYMVMQPYVQMQFKASPGLLLNTGLHYVYSTLTKSQSLEPRISGRWNLDVVSFITFSYGLHSQMQLPQNYFTKSVFNGHLDFTKAHHLVAGYTKRFREILILKTELYYQRLYNVPVSRDSNQSFSALNLLETSIVGDLINEGKGKNYGIDVSLEQHIKNGFYFLANTSLYNSRYTASDGKERDTRFNGNYLLSLSAGKEFKWVRNHKTSFWGINLRIVNAGGMRYTPLDLQASAFEGRSVYLEKEAFSKQLKNFFRIDLRLSWRKNKNNYTRTIAIDFQNLSNVQNPAYYYYDPLQKKEAIRYQLGIIPLITYRLEF